MNDHDYQYIVTLLKDKSGIDLGHDRKQLVKSRLEHLIKDYEKESVEDFINFLRSQTHHALLTEQVISALTTNESFFFRDKKPFDLLEHAILPAIIEKNRASKRIRIWSAACSQGQEAYSISMTILEKFMPQLKDWDIRIIGTDIDKKVLDYARAGVYSSFEAKRGTKPNILSRYFTEDGNKFKVKDEVKKFCEFSYLNLISFSNFPVPFDVVFCRNVLIYFDKETKQQILSQITNNMAPHSPLILGGAETTVGISDRYERVYSGDSSYFMLKDAPQLEVPLLKKSFA